MNKEELKENIGRSSGDYTDLDGVMELIEDFIKQEIGKERVRGELEALEDLKDYIFINDNFRNSDTQPGWDDFRRYAKEMERIYKEELSKLKDNK